MARYTLSCSGLILDRLRRLGDRARALGLTAEYRAALAKLKLELENRPLTYGERSFDYYGLDLMVFHAIIDMLNVHYAVDATRRIVYLRTVGVMSNHPLADAD